MGILTKRILFSKEGIVMEDEAKQKCLLDESKIVQDISVLTKR